MNEMNYNDAVERLRASLPANDLRIAEIMERVKGRYVDTDWDDDLRRVFNNLLRTVVTRRVHKGQAMPDRRETRALVVVGEAGTGKTESLRHLFLTHPSLPGYDRIGSGCPLVTVTVPSPCTLKTLGMRILNALGYPLARDKKEHLVWDDVRTHLQLSGVLVLHLDEMHNLTDRANVDEIDTIRKTLKSLMASTTWPVGLVISGIPDIVPDLQKIDEIRRRGRFIRVPLLKLPADLEMIKMVIAGLADRAGIAVEAGLADAVAPRLGHAALARFGILLELVHEAIEIALQGDEPLSLESFATAYTDRTGVGQLMNPFVAPYWSEIDCSLVLMDEHAEDPVLSDAPPWRTRGQKSHGKRQGGK